MEATNHWYAYLLAPLLVETKDRSAYQRLCRQSLDQFADVTGDVAYNVALLNLLGPDSSTELPIVHALLDRSLASVATGRSNPYYLSVKALADYRSGHHAQVVRQLESLLDDLSTGQIKAGRFVRVQAYAVLAMAHHSLGHLSEAREALNQARTVAPTKTQIPPNGDYGSWHEWLTLQIHLREASSMIEGTSAKAAVPSSP